MGFQLFLAQGAPASDDGSVGEETSVGIPDISVSS